MAQPDTLSKLSLDTFAKYAVNLITKLIEAEAPDDGIQNVELVCLQNLFNGSPLPNKLIDLTVNRILTVLDEFLLELECKKYINKHLLSKALKSLVSRMNGKIQPESYFFKCAHKYGSAKFKSFMINNILATKRKYSLKMKVLNYQHARNSLPYRINDMRLIDPVLFSIRSHHAYTKPITCVSLSCCKYRIEAYALTQLHNLEDYQGFCDDKLISVMLSSCKSLKCLKFVYYSDVTDKSVQNFLKFECLEYLDIVNTEITSEGVTTLLNGLLEKGTSSRLKRLHFKDATLDHLNILQNLPELKVILSMNEDIHDNRALLSGLGRIKNIQGIRSSLGNYYLSHVISVLGIHLIYLSINITYTSLSTEMNVIRMIGKNCSLLKCLHITSSFNHPRESSDVTLNGFESVTCLKFKEIGEGDIERRAESGLLRCLLPKCIGLKKMSFISSRAMQSKTNFVRKLLVLNPMKDIEEVYLHAKNYSVEDDLQASDLLFTNCLNLKVVGGLKVISRGDRK